MQRPHTSCGQAGRDCAPTGGKFTEVWNGTTGSSMMWPANGGVHTAQFCPLEYANHPSTAPPDPESSSSRIMMPVHQPLQNGPPPVEAAPYCHISDHQEQSRAHFVLASRLRAALPRDEIVYLLVNTYFFHAHFLVLVFHRAEFEWKLSNVRNETATASFLGTLLAVLCAALEYSEPDRRFLLEQHGLQSQQLQSSIETILNESWPAIAALGTLEATQCGVLLGSFYLDRGDAEKFWPICGRALQMALALNLHRRYPASNGPSQYAEARKLCWWALFEMETFACLRYDRESLIVDADCDVDFLDPTIGWASPAGPNLLEYKTMMSKLSVIVKAALKTLYAPKQHSEGNSTNRDSEFWSLISDVRRVGARLVAWYSGLPAHLHLGERSSTGPQWLNTFDVVVAYRTSHLQAMMLVLAFENTRILVYRRLLSFEFCSWVTQQAGSNSSPSSALKLFKDSIATCHDAGLKMAEYGVSAVHYFTIHIYAPAFINSLTFTAGVALCLSAMINPLGTRVAAAKLGLQKVLRLQKALRFQKESSADALPSATASIILEKLIRRMMDQELACIVGADDKHETKQISWIRSEADLEIGHLEARTISHPSSNVAESSVHAESNTLSASAIMEETAMFNNLLGFEDVFSTFCADVASSPATAGSVPDGLDHLPEQAWIWKFNDG